MSVALPVKGSRDLDLSLLRRAELSEVGAELLMEPSDLAFTSLSLAAAVLVMGCRVWTETELIIRINW